MNGGKYEFDLVVLTADQDMKSTFEGLLNRTAALGIRNIKQNVFKHPERDPGCLCQADDFLRPFCNRAAFAIVAFDHDGCGRESETRENLEKRVVQGLSRSGWGDRASVIVIDPELENWVFSDSPEVDKALGWKDNTLRKWLEDHNHLIPGEYKPMDPKKAMEAALLCVRRPRSSSIYGNIADKVGLGRCSDPAFIKLKQTLQAWFSTDLKP